MTKEIRDKIAKYGSQIDIFIEKQEYEKLKLLLDEMEQYASTEEEIKNDALFNYFLGTGYGTYSDSIISSGKAPIDTAVVEMRRKSMFCLREAIKNAIPADHIDSRIKFRILTNYANELDNAGRVFEALRIYREVLKENEKFSMALGNYGRALLRLLDYKVRIIILFLIWLRIRCFIQDTSFYPLKLYRYLSCNPSS